MNLTSSKSINNRKPIALFCRLDAEERKKFRQFLESPLFVSHPATRKHLLTFFDRCVKVKIWENEVDKATFLGKSSLKSGDNAFDKLVSTFYQKLIAFIALLESQQENASQFKAAMKFYRERGLDSNEIIKFQNLALKEMNKGPKDADYYYYRLNLELEKAISMSHRMKKPEERGFGLLHRHLDNYYLTQKFRFLCATCNEDLIFGTNRLQELLPNFENWISGLNAELPWIAQLYKQTLHILTGSKAAEHHAQLNQILQNLSPKEIKAYNAYIGELFGYLLNYRLRKLNRGDTTQLAPLNQLYDQVVRNRKEILGEYIPHEIFKNIVSIKAKLEDFSGARQFWEEHHQRVFPNLEGTIGEYNLAVIEFHEGNFADAISRLEKLMHETGQIKLDQMYGLDIRFILLKAYYQFQEQLDSLEWEAVDEKVMSLVKTVDAYIQRRKLSETRKEHYQNIRKLYLRLYQGRYGVAADSREQKKTVAQLKNDLQGGAFSGISDIQWFEERIEVIESGWGNS